MNAIYADPRWIRERPRALLDAVRLIGCWLDCAVSGGRRRWLCNN